MPCGVLLYGCHVGGVLMTNNGFPTDLSLLFRKIHGIQCPEFSFSSFIAVYYQVQLEREREKKKAGG